VAAVDQPAHRGQLRRDGAAAIDGGEEVRSAARPGSRVWTFSTPKTRSVMIFSVSLRLSAMSRQQGEHRRPSCTTVTADPSCTPSLRAVRSGSDHSIRSACSEHRYRSSGGPSGARIPVVMAIRRLSATKSGTPPRKAKTYGRYLAPFTEGASD